MKSSRIVAWRAGGRRRGSSPSKPSRTWSSPNSGRTSETGCSSESSPASMSWSAAALTIDLVIDAIQIIVSGTTSWPSSTLRTPKAPS